MFGLFGDKKTRQMKRVERAMIVMGNAAASGDLRTLHVAIQAHTNALGELHFMDVSEGELDRFLDARGKVTWHKNETFRERLGDLAFEAEKLFWDRR